MSDSALSQELEMSSDPNFERRFEVVERIAQIVGLLLIALIALGITGSGPLSRASAQNGDESLVVDYSRFARRDAPATIRITALPAQVSNGQIEIWVGTTAIEDYDLEHITPEPGSVELDGDRMILTFPVASLNEATEIFLALRPRRIGPQNFNIGSVDGSTLKVSQFVYP